jgi:hypothetical protein
LVQGLAEQCKFFHSSNAAKISILALKRLIIIFEDAKIVLKFCSFMKKFLREDQKNMRGGKKNIIVG